MTIFEASFEMCHKSPLHACCQWKTIAAWLTAMHLCLYLKHAGKKCLRLAAFTWGSERIDLGAVFWREACDWQKLPGIRHVSYLILSLYLVHCPSSATVADCLMVRTVDTKPLPEDISYRYTKVNLPFQCKTLLFMQPKMSWSMNCFAIRWVDQLLETSPRVRRSWRCFWDTLYNISFCPSVITQLLQSACH
jgi:hypothetical protein